MTYCVLEVATEGLNVKAKRIGTVKGMHESKTKAEIQAGDLNLTKHYMSVNEYIVVTMTEAKTKYDLRA